MRFDLIFLVSAWCIDSCARTSIALIAIISRIATRSTATLVRCLSIVQVPAYFNVKDGRVGEDRIFRSVPEKLEQHTNGYIYFARLQNMHELLKS